MIGSGPHAKKRRDRVSPFLMRFARDCISEDGTSGQKQPSRRTFITEVRRETTDDR
jgi:hypothetical protein